MPPWLASLPFLFQARPVAKQDWKLFTWTVNILRLQDWEWGDQVSFKIYPNLLVQIVYLVFYIYWLIEVESNICSHKKVHTEHKTQIANKQKKLQSRGEVNVYIIIIVEKPDKQSVAGSGKHMCTLAFFVTLTLNFRISLIILGGKATLSSLFQIFSSTALLPH